ncbi:MAG TPA: ABC transporter substrate-binding protein [Polyangiaceae bacterium]|nr:ABC transporter substrate-binding protein [Polyangiaceae bacterium]
MSLGRRWFCYAAATLLLGSFAACKKSGEGAAPAGSSAGAKTEATGLVVGHYASMTGSTAHFGQDTDKAVRMAVDEANANGGVLGKPVKLTTLDDRGDTAEAASAVTRLIDVEHVNALIGEVASSLSLAGARIAQRRGIPMISPSSTNPKVTQVGDYIFRVCFIDPFQGKVMATFARNTLKLDQVAILKDVKSDYSIGLADTFKTAFVALGGKIAVEQSYAAGDTDFSAQVTAVKATKAQALYVPGYYSEAGSIARTAQRLGLKVPLLGGDGWDAPELFSIGGDALDGSYFSNHFAPDGASPKGKAFMAAFKQKYGTDPTGLGMLGYDAAALLFDAVKRAGTTNGAAVRDALAQTKGFEGVTGKITMDKDRNPEKAAVILKISGGKAEYVGTVEP